MATYGCTVEWDGVNAVIKGQRGLSSVQRFQPGGYLVTVDPTVSLAEKEFAVSCTLCNLPIPLPMGSVVNPLPIKFYANLNRLYILTVLDNMLVDCSFDLIVETYRS